MKKLLINLIIISASISLQYGCENKQSHSGPLSSITALADKSLPKIKEIDRKGEKTAGSKDIKTIQELLRKKLELEKNTEEKLNRIVAAESNKEIPFEQKGEKDKFIVKRINFKTAFLQDSEITINLEAEIETFTKVPTGIECIIVNQKGIEIRKEKLITDEERSHDYKPGEHAILYCTLLASKIPDMDKIIIL